MGTNYYYHELDTNHCAHCGRCDKGRKLHIGKSSGGWCFLLHVDDEFSSLADWQSKWSEGGRIIDEYGDEHTAADMLAVITERKCNPGPVGPWYSSWAEFHARNSSCAGPNNLVRCRIDGEHCIGHGEGTWDLIAGYFS